MTKLVVCLDGTWNTESSFTNVWRLNVALDRSPDQKIYYDRGVGTRTVDYVTGGSFGQGLSNNVLKAYLWLTEHYRPGNEVFVFGFSRGAYTARSLVGFLSVCGLLRPDAVVNIDAAFKLYRRPGLGRYSPSARDFRLRHSLEPVHPRPLRIKLLGVFETVGALGVPSIGLPLFEDFRWHKVHLSEIVDHACHALAIDEHRQIFDCTVWSNQHPGQTVEQRWFAGAHANVGGGYEHDLLSIRPLEWMQDKAKQHGLRFHFDPCRVTDRGQLCSFPLADSWSEFLGGSYSKYRTLRHGMGSPRFYRTIGSPQYWHPDRLVAAAPGTARRMLDKVKGGLANWVSSGGETTPEVGVGQVIDASVIERVRRNPQYRPPNLKPFFSTATWGA